MVDMTSGNGAQALCTLVAITLTWCPRSSSPSTCCMAVVPMPGDPIG
jgi:hypothetical protein